jgi:integrase
MLRLKRRSIVTVYVRHAGTCANADKPFYRGCSCAKWLRYSKAGKGQIKQPAETRTWAIAEEKAQQLQMQLDAGDSPSASTSTAETTIATHVTTFLLGKRSGAGGETLRKLTAQLGRFEAFMTSRGKLYPREITPTDCIEYRATWQTWGDLTSQKAQSNLRGFLKFCCRENRVDLLDALGKIKLTREGKQRRKPKPYTEEEIKTLLAQVPKTFPDPVKAQTVDAAIRFMIATGVAIRDTVQMERTSIRDGWLRFDRQKTGSPVVQRLDPGLHQELLAVLNGNPRYVFWNGSSMPISATVTWLRDIRAVMQDAGLYIKGNLAHRFRDTATDFWLGAGCSINEIAGMLGDKPEVVQKHYADMISKRMEDRLAKLPVRTW